MNSNATAEKTARIQSLIREITLFDDAAFGASILEVMGDLPVPSAHPERGMHPRVMLNRDMIPAILKQMEREEVAPALAEYRALRDTVTDGKLPPSYLHETGRRGHHNYDYRLLAVIQAKALEYLLTGDACYGYEAILAIKNFLVTLDVKWIHSDQCREFGYAMYITACVYDWCYPLLTERDRFQLTAGVEHLLCRGQTEDTVHSTYHGVKMEMGFPPSGMGAISGHGSEMQLLRDYLSYSIAIYDEHPGWWEFCGSRFYLDFTSVRNIYYMSGMTQQGTACYAPWRHLADLWSAWLIRAMNGTMPYIPEMKDTVRSLFGHELPRGGMISTGDGRINALSPHLSYCAVFASALFDDPTLRAEAKHVEHGFSKFAYGVANVTPAEFLILNSRGTETADDRHAGMPLMQYNPYPLGQIIARTSWDDDDAPVCFLRLNERTTANHEHGDTGTFQLFYKEKLTCGTGIYAGYGTDHHYFYHQATVAQNGLLFYDASLAETDRGWYSGSQRRIGETGSLAAWLSPTYRKATEIGMETGQDYAYLAGDITAAYPSQTVSFAQRRMLTVFTGDRSTPMLLFVYDKTTSVEETCRKSFLLHSMKEPTVLGNTVIAPASEAKLTLTALLGGEITTVGGAGRAYEIGGRNLLPDGRDDDRASVEWGRIEVSKTGNLSDDFLHVIAASDIGADAPPAVGHETSTLAVASSGNVVAVFVKCMERTKDIIAFDTIGEEKRCFVSGVCHGKYSVSVDGREIATVTATEKGGMLSFRAPAGSVRVVPID